MFGLVIIFCLASTLLPMLTHLQGNLANKKTELHASEVALNGARIVQLYGITSGEMTIQKILYAWHYSAGEICVDFDNVKGRRQKCVGL